MTQERKIRELRAERVWLLGRHEPHNAQTAVFDVIKNVEIELAWHEHALLIRADDGALTETKPQPPTAKKGNS